MKLSREFLIRLKLGPERAYQIAQRAGVNPTTLSKAVSGITPVRPDDPRIIAVGRLLGLTDAECFESMEACGEQGD